MAKSKEKELLKDVAESKRWLKEHPNVEKKYIKMAESYEPKEKAKELDRNKFFRIPALHFHPEKVRVEKEKNLGFNLDSKEIEDKVNKELRKEPAYLLGLVEDREGVIQEIEKLFMNGDIEFWVLYKKDWEKFKRKNER